jgi:hypothetical protein
VTRGGGGGGGNETGTPTGIGGTGGGGNGGTNNLAPTAGTANTGGGGGAADGSNYNGAAGGSGVIILKYPASRTLTVGAGLTSSTATVGSFKVTTFTAGADTVTIS